MGSRDTTTTEWVEEQEATCRWKPTCLKNIFCFEEIQKRYKRSRRGVCISRPFSYFAEYWITTFKKNPTPEIVRINTHLTGDDC